MSDINKYYEETRGKVDAYSETLVEKILEFADTNNIDKCFVLMRIKKAINEKMQEL